MSKAEYATNAARWGIASPPGVFAASWAGVDVVEPVRPG